MLDQRIWACTCDEHQSHQAAVVAVAFHDNRRLLRAMGVRQTFSSNSLLPPRGPVRSPEVISLASLRSTIFAASSSSWSPAAEETAPSGATTPYQAVQFLGSNPELNARKHLWCRSTIVSVLLLTCSSSERLVSFTALKQFGRDRKG